MIGKAENESIKYTVYNTDYRGKYTSGSLYSATVNVREYRTILRYRRPIDFLSFRSSSSILSFDESLNLSEPEALWSCLRFGALSLNEEDEDEAEEAEEAVDVEAEGRAVLALPLLAPFFRSASSSRICF